MIHVASYACLYLPSTWRKEELCISLEEVFGIDSQDVQQILKRQLTRWIRNLKHAIGIPTQPTPIDAGPYGGQRKAVTVCVASHIAISA